METSQSTTAKAHKRHRTLSPCISDAPNHFSSNSPSESLIEKYEKPKIRKTSGDLPGCEECYNEQMVWFQPKTILSDELYKKIVSDNQTVENQLGLICEYCGCLLSEVNHKGNHCHCHIPDCEDCYPSNFCTYCKRCLIQK